MVGCTAQGVSISRSCAMSYCEPCQSLTAAALSRRWRVPQGNFEGATYVVSASVMFIEDGAQFFCMKLQIGVCIRKSPHLRTFLMFWVVDWCSNNFCFLQLGFFIAQSDYILFCNFELMISLVVCQTILCNRLAVYCRFQMTNCHLMSRFAKVK